MTIPARLGMITARRVVVGRRWRRTGVAGVLDAVRGAAEQCAALRLTLQTEDKNVAALRLYDRYGFRPVTGMRHLMLGLARTGHATD